MKKLGFIGMGNMASAILQGAIQAGYLKGEEILAYDLNQEKLATMAADWGVGRAENLGDLADRCEMLIMAIKPQHLEGALQEMGDKLKDKALVSIALGWNYDRYRKVLPAETRVCFIMPNTPCLAGEGMALIEDTNDLTPDEMAFASGLFASIGSVATLPSNLMGIGGALSGCGPAFIYMVIEALADGAVVYGMPRDIAYKLAAQTVLGAGKMVLETGTHPGVLKDNVCSPGGSTIRGVKALEDAGLRSTMMKALDAANL